MYKTKLLPFAIVAILIGSIISSAAGQKRTPIPAAEPPVPAETINPVETINPDLSKFSGVEVSPGETNYAVATTYGATYYGQTFGDRTGSFFVSVNYSLPGTGGPTAREAGSDTSDMPQPIDQSSLVTGGSWTRQVFIDGKYVGSVYGRITGGTVTWSQTDLSATVDLELAVDNGTEKFLDRTGKGQFHGKLDRMSKLPIISGDLTLEY